jgi:glycosyltransferase involved in cell wall biosynthesis
LTAPAIPAIPLRTALVHDWFQGYFGAEQVVDTISRSLFADDNQPDIFTFYAARPSLPPQLVARIRAVHWATRLPGMQQRQAGSGGWRYLLPLMPLYFSRLRLDEYELVLSSSHSFAMHVRPPAETLNVCYCHTPLRYAWMPRERGDEHRGLPGLGLRAARGWLQRLDRRASRRPDAFVANSAAVRERIRRFYGRDATVIHPPVRLDDIKPRPNRGGDFLWVHRLVPHKRPEVVVQAFRGLPYRLTMVGTGWLEPSLRPSLPPNVRLIPWLQRDELVQLLEDARGFVHIGEEDFGMSMVEALAAGTPVIAVNRGGARDIVRPGVDGLLIESPDPNSLQQAVIDCASRSWDAEALALRAREFSSERFAQHFRAHLGALGVP